MIPRTIHYIWLGRSVKPALMQRCIQSWHDHLPDFRIVEWNEDNFDLSSSPWLKSMYASGKYAFASDFVRLKVLQQFGGVYLDTDLEVFNSFCHCLDAGMILGFMYDDCALSTALIGSIPNHPALAGLISIYESLDKQSAIINNTIMTKYFLAHYPSFRLTGREQTIADDIHIFPKDYFEIPSKKTDRGFTRHHGSNTWLGLVRKQSLLKRVVNLALGDELYYALSAYKNRKSNEFYHDYICHKRLERSERNSR
jgi:Glycosyltransferase sugar-binding region containing DXD motif